MVEISAALAADLALLDDAVSDPDVDVVEILTLLARDAKAAVESFIGLSLSLDPGQPMSFTSFEAGVDPTGVASSVLLPLSQLRPAGKEIGVTLILYAARPGAFVDLAADLAWQTGRDPASFPLDRHLELPDASTSLHALREGSMINQALGVLIGEGHLPDSAARELESRAAAAGTTLYRMAVLILAATAQAVADIDMHED